MARLRDIKVGMTVWIKKGKTSVESFGWRFTDSIMKTIGTSVLVDEVDPGDPLCTVSAGDWWYPVDWISLTPPKKDPSLSGVASNEASKETPIKDTPKQKLYVAVSGCEVTEPGTLEQVVNSLQDVWNYTEDEIVTTKIYELTEVNIKYTPAKFEVVE